MQRWTVTLLLAFAASALAAPGNLQNVGDNKNLDGDAGVAKRMILGCQAPSWLTTQFAEVKNLSPFGTPTLSIEIAETRIQLAVTSSPNLLSYLSVKYFS
ncbi:hypothetical protein HOO65_050574 [Ceratocystis lukuohia]|uniref:Uncharacterized protein n=1 Tax=Ceratocystis lukuohia TaxID=2019550 RepID=A0ABR4MGP6_9PEZI